MSITKFKYALVALSVAGSAILLSACDRKSKDRYAADEGVMTEYSEDLSVVESQNGRRSYSFSTPLLEGYGQAKDPYREFRKGIKMITYQDDSLSTVNVVLTANYAINYSERGLWETKGNVVVSKSDGTTFYFQQLAWNARTKRVYSNLDGKMVQNEGRDIVLFQGFDSDEEFKDWRFRRGNQHMEVEFDPRTRRDSLPANDKKDSGENENNKEIKK